MVHIEEDGCICSYGMVLTIPVYTAVFLKMNLRVRNM